MLGIRQRRGWRGAIGLIAAYALVLQAFLAYGMASQAAAHGDSPDSGAFLRDLHHAGQRRGCGRTGVPVKPVTHCPICTLSGSAAATLPPPVSLPLPASRPGRASGLRFRRRLHFLP